jgi:hypothetical protein
VSQLGAQPPAQASTTPLLPLQQLLRIQLGRWRPLPRRRRLLQQLLPQQKGTEAGLLVPGCHCGCHCRPVAALLLLLLLLLLLGGSKGAAGVSQGARGGPCLHAVCCCCWRGCRRHPQRGLMLGSLQANTQENMYQLLSLLHHSQILCITHRMLQPHMGSTPWK